MEHVGASWPADGVYQVPADALVLVVRPRADWLKGSVDAQAVEIETLAARFAFPRFGDVGSLVQRVH